MANIEVNIEWANTIRMLIEGLDMIKSVTKFQSVNGIKSIEFNKKL